MRAFNIYIDKYDWLCRVYLNADRFDIPEITKFIKSIRCGKGNLRRIEDNLTYEVNNGVTCTNAEDRISVIIFGKSSSPEEFADTFTHEIIHASVHIANNNGIDLEDEEVCYIGGYISKLIYPYCKKNLCCMCH